MRPVFATSTQRPAEDCHEPLVRFGKNSNVAPNLSLTDWQNKAVLKNKKMASSLEVPPCHEQHGGFLAHWK